MAATLEAIDLEVEELNDAMKETKKKTGVLAFVRDKVWKDERQKLEARKKLLVEQKKCCKDIIAEWKHKQNIAEMREITTEEVAKSEEKLRQLEKDIIILETGVLTQVKELSKAVHYIDWEVAFKPRLIALYGETRALKEQLEKV